jgi:hypothetical protein
MHQEIRRGRPSPCGGQGVVERQGATQGEQRFHLHVEDCWRGLWRAKQLAWVNFAGFELYDYEYCDSPLNADLHELVPGKLIAFGEVGLAGEIRPVVRGQDRIKEAAKLGFTRAIVPAANRPKQPVEGIEIVGVKRIEEALEALRG